MRGEFLRAWDDSRGIDAGREIGTWQKGTLSVVDTGTAGVFTPATTLTSGFDAILQAAGLDAYDTADFAQMRLAYANAAGAVPIPGIAGEMAYSGTTRPRNVALTACIKY